MANARLVEAHNELEWRRCTRSCSYFLNNYWTIQHPARGPIPFKMRDPQRYALKHWSKNRYSLTLKSRQIGWTTLIGGYQFWLAWFHPARIVLDLSKGEREAKNILDMTKFGFMRLPAWMLERGPKPVTETQKIIEFDNGSEVTSLPSASNPARGRSASLVVVDEWAFLGNPEEAWASIEPIADIGGSIIGLSTANGSGNFFHNLWTGAETGNNQFQTMFFGWDAVPERDEAWYERKKSSLAPWQLAQEYPATPAEAFAKSGRIYFDADALAKQQPTEPEFGTLQAIGGKLSNVQWRPNYSTIEHMPDNLAVWETPEDSGVYCIGADVAEGLDHGDFSSAHVIRLFVPEDDDKDNPLQGVEVANWHGHIPPDEFAHTLYSLAYWYNTALLGPEGNNHGATVITELRKLKYPKLYVPRSDATNIRKGTFGQKFGWWTSRASKPRILDALDSALRNDAIRINCSSTLGELRTFVRNDRGQLVGSPYDDRTMSLAIGWEMLQHVHDPKYRVESTNEYFSYEWFLAQEAPSSANGWAIGSNSVRAS